MIVLRRERKTQLNMLTAGAIDSIAGGLVTEAAKFIGRRIAHASATMTDGTASDEYLIARHFDTYQLANSNNLTDATNPPNDPELVAWLESHETQGIVHTLLSARLIDAPEIHIESLREHFLASYASTVDSTDQSVALALFEDLEDQVANVVRSIISLNEAHLDQLRNEAYFAQAVGSLHAINRQLAAIVKQADHRAEWAQCLRQYRLQAMKHHSKIEPPDFKTRRRVHVDDIYVPPIITAERRTGPTFRGPAAMSGQAALTGRRIQGVQTTRDLPGLIDRTVLLGDPGGGKTTTSNYLIHHLASIAHHPTPFLVTLRDLARDAHSIPPVVDYISRRTASFYQAHLTPEQIECLLSTGSALVIFDGLDELIDTSKRSDMASIIEMFAERYPLARILVTSRVVGYDEARLDIRRFSIWRLAGFDDARVEEYVSKWFAQEDDLTPAMSQEWAGNFIEESRSVPDLRRNPLMLALMCILYRGYSYIPQNRAEVYKQCAQLLFHTWDARRDIISHTRVRNSFEPAVRHLAYWLFTKEPSGSPVTETQLIQRVTTVLHAREYESKDTARLIAEEFVAFCRGRAWVFSDAGLNAKGETLYTFTHRTFLEYFAASYLSVTSDTPEKLAAKLTPYIAKGEWEIIGQLAMQLKEEGIDRGVERAYLAFMKVTDHKRRSLRARSNVVSFLGRGLAANSLPPKIVRTLTNKAINLLREDIGHSLRGAPLAELIRSADDERTFVQDEIEKAIPTLLAAKDSHASYIATILATWATFFVEASDADNVAKQEEWDAWQARIFRKYRSDVILSHIFGSEELIMYCIRQGLISPDEVLASIDRGVDIVFSSPEVFMGDTGATWTSLASGLLFSHVCWAPWVNEKFAQDIKLWAESVAHALSKRTQELERRVNSAQTDLGFVGRGARAVSGEDYRPSAVSPTMYGAIAYVLAVAWEVNVESTSPSISSAEREGEKQKSTEEIKDIVESCSISSFRTYLEARHTGKSDLLPHLPTTSEWNSVLTSWALRKISFSTAPPPQGDAGATVG
ncbi:NACHT domain-containing protein [Nonomuraea fuscirosea]|uniref:NACHT domain-containing protein n=1 Tax=Nonomuraea fuscirosea TaxID=1291556 RepID=UPI003721E788